MPKSTKSPLRTLVPSVQTYLWGSVHTKSLVFNLCNNNDINRKELKDVSPETPFAELWIGSHPNADDHIIVDNTLVLLNKYLKEKGIEVCFFV